MKIRVGHLYPDYLNIYADRGNIAVLDRRAGWRGIELVVEAIGVGDPVEPGRHDLYYVGGGQDREQALIAPDLAAKGAALREAVDGGAAVLAVCGGYQLLGAFYRDVSGAEQPGAGVLPLYTVAGDTRMIGDCLLECEQALIAPDLAAKGAALREAVGGGAAVLAVCGGYQLLGAFYRDVSGAEHPGAGVLPLYTVAGDTRMIGDCLLECELERGVRRTLAGFENHAGRTHLDDGAEPLGRVIAGFGNDGESGFEGCRVGRAVGTYLHGPLLPRNPWLADWLLTQALAHAQNGAPPELEPLGDELEERAHIVSSARARARGGK